MKVLGALTAGLVLALVPAGTAFAGERPVPGNAYGNCKHSSSGGVHTPSGKAGNGNGGMVSIAKAAGGGPCVELPGAVDEETDEVPGKPFTEA